MPGEIQSFVDNAGDDTGAAAALPRPEPEKSGRNKATLALGALFFIGSLLLLVWNEGCSVEAMHRLHAAYNTKLVHLSGPVATDEVLSDEVFYVSVNAVKLQRVVEMYQWHEDVLEKEAVYHRAWSQTPLQSASFQKREGHENPPMPYVSTDYSASAATLGGVELSPKVIEQVSAAKEYPMTPDTFAKINPELSGFRLNGDEYYSGKNPEMPAVGDIRVRFRIVEPGDTVSVSGRQDGNRLDIAALRGGEGIGGDTAMTWGIRFGGWLAMFIGLMLVFVSLQIYNGSLPVLGVMAAFGVRLVAMVMATVLTLIVIAVIWFSHSPGTAMALLVAASAIVVASTFVKKPQPPIPGAVKYFKVPRRTLVLALNPPDTQAEKP